MANSADKMSQQSIISDDPNEQSQSDPQPIPGSDPLLGSDAFIAADPVEAEGSTNQSPVDRSSEAKRAKRTRKGPEEAAAAGETPGWLPPGWTVICRTRTAGATAGLIDRYYMEPTTGQRFRSKIEVNRFLETGSKSKSASVAKATPSETSSKDKVKSSTKTKKTVTKKKEAAWSFNFENPPEEVTWSLVDGKQGLWKPSIGEEEVPETTAQQWATTFERVCKTG